MVHFTMDGCMLPACLPLPRGCQQGRRHCDFHFTCIATAYLNTEIEGPNTNDH